MSKYVYVLKHYVNDYNQRDGYVKAIFKDKPDFHKLKAFFMKAEDEETPESSGCTFDAVCGMLSRGEEVCVFGSGGGDSWAIVPEELL